jgi:hypothetical protein
VDELPRVELSGDFEGDYVVLAERPGGVLKIAPAQPGGAPVVATLTQTCPAFPSQWEGTLEDGRSLYLRYRGGGLSVGVGAGGKEAVRNSMSDQAFFFERVGDSLDGYMEFKELRLHLHGLLQFPEGLVVEGESDWGFPVPGEDD